MKTNKGDQMLQKHDKNDTLTWLFYNTVMLKYKMTLLKRHVNKQEFHNFNL